MSVMLVSQSAVRDYLELNATASSSRYSDATIGSNILMAQTQLEQATGRYFVNRDFTAGAPWVTTSMLRAIVPIPGFRTLTTVTYGGATVTANASYWALPDAQQTGVYTGLQFRAFRADGQPNWWYADPNWFDKALDSPFYPGNYGGGYAYTSMPNDLTIVGSAGYDNTVEGGVPYPVLNAIKVYAAFETMRPTSLLADVAITPQGGVINYSQMPAEVRDFIAQWRIGQQAVSVG